MEEVQAYLEEAYCGHLSVETSQLSSPEEREWFADRFEELKKTRFSSEERRRLAMVMLESQVNPRKRGRIARIYNAQSCFMWYRHVFSLPTCRNLTTF